MTEIASQDFLAAVDDAVAEALPAGWPRLSPERLRGRGVARVRHGFPSLAGAGRHLDNGAEPRGPTPGTTGAADSAGSPDPEHRRDDRPAQAAADRGNPPGPGAAAQPAAWVGLLAIPLQRAGFPDAPAARELVRLRNRALARGAYLLVLFEQRERDRPDDFGVFVENRLDLPHPRFLVLPCVRGAEGAWTVRLTPAAEEPVAGVVEGFWSGELAFAGPVMGRQTVGVEVMRDTCRHCGQALERVTGLVFPDLAPNGRSPRPDRTPGGAPASWSGGDWRCFARLLPVAELEAGVAAALAAAVAGWRRAERRLTPLALLSHDRRREVRWTALCPCCGAARDALTSDGRRDDLLLDRAARRDGRLTYRPWELDLSQALIQTLVAGVELGVYSRPVGWEWPARAAGSGDAVAASLPAAVAVPQAPAVPVLAAARWMRVLAGIRGWAPFGQRRGWRRHTGRSRARSA